MFFLIILLSIFNPVFHSNRLDFVAISCLINEKILNLAFCCFYIKSKEQNIYFKYNFINIILWYILNVSNNLKD